MPVAPLNMEGIVPCRADVYGVNVFRHLFVIQLFFTRPLIDTRRTRTGASQIGAVVFANVAVFPVNGKIGGRVLFEFNGLHGCYFQSKDNPSAAVWGFCIAWVLSLAAMLPAIWKKAVAALLPGSDITIGTPSSP